MYLNDIKDFNDTGHRIDSATAVFQKGIYHLHFLKNQEGLDIFVRVLRTYQCLFQLCLTELLLDFSYQLRSSSIPVPLKKHCSNPKEPTRSEIDPSAIVTHSVFEKGTKGYWGGPPKGHHLYTIGQRSLDLINKVIEARHNLIYRPFLLNRGGKFWEDCSLLDLLQDIPNVDEVETAYKEFIQAMLKLYLEEQEKWKNLPPPPPLTTKRLRPVDKPVQPFYSTSFLEGLFDAYRDIRNNRLTETLLLSYARMLNPDNLEIVDSIKVYQRQLFNSVDFFTIVNIGE